MMNLPQIIHILSEIRLDGVLTTVTASSEYDANDLRIVRYSDQGLEWTKVLFKTTFIAILAAPSLSGLKYAVSVPDDSTIVFSGK